ncbi:MAG TPA: UDP-2,3-diacylglucosamine diphosphatase LpxI [Caulobacterales bacterium]|nr:UDP-2,3-diacylglucosamine diphosphatase LpxI [Caulobacterales bacterium]
MAEWRKLGIIAGGGELPVAIAESARDAGQPYFVARIAGYADAALNEHPGAASDLGEFAGRVAAMKTAGCDAVVIAGQVARVDLGKLKLDAGAMQFMQILSGAASAGDDPLLRALVQFHSDAGFQVVGAERAAPNLAAPAGVLGALSPNDRDLKDMRRGAAVVAALGPFDIGQAVAVADNLVLGVEAQEGTDGLLRRLRDLPLTVRGDESKRRGVLVKRPKPMQERRIDLPVVGLRTLEGASAAGLAGIAVEAGGALVLQRAALVEAADRFGMFLYGFTRGEVGET